MAKLLIDLSIRILQFETSAQQTSCNHHLASKDTFFLAVLDLGAEEGFAQFGG